MELVLSLKDIKRFLDNLNETKSRFITLLKLKDSRSTVGSSHF